MAPRRRPGSEASVKRQIKKHLRDFIAIVVLVVLAVVVGGYILSQQRLNAPGWVPFIGKDLYTVKAAFEAAQGVQAGQGQAVKVAGVKVGSVTGVELQGGQAVVTMQVEKKYAPIYRDAQLLLRPNTLLGDMYIEMDVGTAQAGEVASGTTLSSANTEPTVNQGEFLSVLDADTRDYLVLLIGGASRGFQNNTKALNETLKRFDPLSRNTKLVFREIAKRRDNLRTLTHNIQLLANEIGDHDRELAGLIDSTNAVFKSFANEQGALRASIRELAPTLTTATTALRSSDRLARVMGPAFRKLVPGARAFQSSTKSFSDFAQTTEPVVREKLRPFARDAQPVLKELKPAAKDLARAAPSLTASFKNLNRLLNELNYNPSGSEEGYLFWLAWFQSSLSSVLSQQDAQGALLRSIGMLRCPIDVNLLKGVAADPRFKVAQLLINSLDVPSC